MKSQITIALAITAGIMAASAQTTIWFTNVSTTNQYNYVAGVAWPDEIIRTPTIDLSADGEITSVSLMPFFNIFDATGQPLPDQLPFEMYVYVNGAPAFLVVDPTSGFTIDPAEFASFPERAIRAITFGVGGNAQSPGYFSFYRREHIAEAQTFTFGFEVESLTYTAVPEPGTWAMLGLGLAAMWIFNRKR